MSSIDDFVHKLNIIPPQTNKLLRAIRQLDKKTQEARILLEQSRESFLKQLEIWKDKKAAKFRLELQQEYRKIVKLQNEVEGYSKEKISIAEKLYNLIHDPTEKLDKELHQRGLDNSVDDQAYSKKKRGKKFLKKNVKKGQWQYNPHEPKYCYCGRPSFGEMVMCQNRQCQREWFHIDCIEQKKLPEVWLCKICRLQENSSVAPKKRFK